MPGRTWFPDWQAREMVEHPAVMPQPMDDGSLLTAAEFPHYHERPLLHRPVYSPRSPGLAEVLVIVTFGFLVMMITGLREAREWRFGTQVFGATARTRAVKSGTR